MVVILIDFDGMLTGLEINIGHVADIINLIREKIVESYDQVKKIVVNLIIYKVDEKQVIYLFRQVKRIVID